MATSRSELTAFLQSRRALQPEDVGLPAGGRRRVPGLRREELAIVAGISPDHYQRIEQGRVHPSDVMIEAIAKALKLTADEQEYLTRLATSAPAKRRDDAVPSALVTIVEANPFPAYVLNPRRDILVWNRAAASLICDFATIPRQNRNIAWLLFTDSRFRDLYVDWAGNVRRLASALRYCEAAYPDDTELATLITRLEAASPEFVRLRALREVAQKCGGIKDMHHPVVGDLAFAYQNLAVTGHDGLELITMAPNDESTADALKLLDSWSSTVISARN